MYKQIKQLEPPNANATGLVQIWRSVCFRRSEYKFDITDDCTKYIENCDVENNRRRCHGVDLTRDRAKAGDACRRLHDVYTESNMHTCVCIYHVVYKNDMQVMPCICSARLWLELRTDVLW